MVLVSLLAVIVGLIAARVEYLNAAADFPLPRIGKHDVGNFREVPWTNEAKWKQSKARQFGYEPFDDDLTQWMLTLAQRQRMEQETARARASNALWSFGTSAGVLQHLLAPLLALGCAVAFARRPTGRRALALLPAIVVLAFAAWSMIHRNYFHLFERWPVAWVVDSLILSA